MAKFPKTLGACIDLAYEAEKARLTKQREFDAQIAEMKKAEQEIQDHIINTFSKNDIEGASGSIAKAGILRSFVPTVKDWPKVWKYIQKTGEFDLLEKRMSATAWRERYEAGNPVPGTEPFEKMKLSLTKINK